MSFALQAPVVWQPALNSTTGRQFRRAVGLAMLLAGFGCLIHVVERYLLRVQRGIADNPIEVMVRAFGLAHFMLGWFFLFTSRRLRSFKAVARLLALAFLGAVSCVAFARFGGITNPLLYLLFYGYFLVHEVRDEARLYESYGDAPVHCPDGPRVLGAISLAASLLLLTLLAAGYFCFLTVAKKDTQLNWGRPLLWVFVGILAFGCGWAISRSVQMGCLTYGDWETFVSAHRPLLTVYGSILLILVLGAPLGSVGLLVLIHVTAWLVFIHYQLGKRRLPPARDPWSWLRSTPTGFCALHLAVAVLLLALMAVRVFVWQRTGLVSALLAKDNFCYWALMHISMSFWSSH